MERFVFTSDGMWLYPSLKEGLDHLKEAVINKWDGVIAIDGVEGSGKTNLAFISAFYVDPSFCLDRVVFTPDQFFDAVDNASVGQAIVYDEFVTGGLSAEALTKVTKALTKKLVMIRKKRLFIFLLIPYIFMLTRYFALARTRYLVHCGTPDGIKRGYFSIYTYKTKNVLYNVGRKYYTYDVVDADYKGYFPSFFSFKTPFSEDDYDSKKDDAIISATEEDELGSLTKFYQKNMLLAIKILYSSGYSRRELNNFFSFNDKTLSNYLTSELYNDEFESIKEDIKRLSAW